MNNNNKNNNRAEDSQLSLLSLLFLLLLLAFLANKTPSAFGVTFGIRNTEQKGSDKHDENTDAETGKN